MEITEKHFWYGLLALILIVSLAINLNVAVSTPIVFGDEGFYASRGEWILHHLEIPKYYHIQGHSEAYRDLFIRQLEPFFLVGSFFALGGEFLVKAMNPILSLLTCLVVFLLVKRMYSLKAGVLSVLFLSMIPSFITYTIFLYAEAFAVLLVTSSILLFYRGLKEDRKILLIFGGILSGFAAIEEAGSIIMPLVFLFIFVLYRKNWLKNFLLVLCAFFIIAFPLYGYRNFLVFGNPGIPVLGHFFDFPSGREILKNIPQTSVGELKSPQQVGIGTGATILKMGILNYIQFAYALGPFIFALIGLSYLFFWRKKKDLMILIWFFTFLVLSYFAISGGRAEDAARAMIYITVPTGIMGGLSSDRIYDFLKGYGENTGKVIAVLFIFVLLCFGLFSIQTKAESLRPIKQFSPAFFKGCDWIRRNTPEDSLLVNLWGHRAEYACKRDSIYATSPGGKAMLLDGNDTSYEIMKAHGASYVYIQKFSIQPGNQMVSYPWVFVKYVMNSDHFKKVYEYPSNCMSSNIQDCVVVYKVL